MVTTNYVQTSFPVMTKASIVQRLLDEKHITAEEAVVLLQSEAPLTNLPQPYIPYTPPNFPINPWTPINPWNPFVTYCGTTLEGKK